MLLALPNHPRRVSFFDYQQIDLNPEVPFLEYMTYPGFKSGVVKKWSPDPAKMETSPLRPWTKSCPASAPNWRRIATVVGTGSDMSHWMGDSEPGNNTRKCGRTCLIGWETWSPATTHASVFCNNPIATQRFCNNPRQRHTPQPNPVDV